VSALTYGVLSLFDKRHLEKAVEYLPEWARAIFLTDVSHDAVETGLFAKRSNKDVIGAFDKVAGSYELFLSVLVGLAYCEKGEERGLKLAMVAARAGSTFEGILGRLFGELAKVLESATVGNCVTDEVLRTVYKLYYRYV